MTNISFVSGTRADYGKIKPYIDFLVTQKNRNVSVFITGMNMLKKHGFTYKFIKKDLNGICKIFIDKKFKAKNTALETAQIIKSFNTYLKKEKIDFVFVHGDRPEVLAAATTAILNNIPVCHIEAGDLSGSVDESIRHATSKLSQQFLVADEKAKNILLKMGEDEKCIHVVGNSSLAFEINEPTKKEKKQLNKFKNYAILIYHPVTTLSSKFIKNELTQLLEKLQKINKEIIIISPNNDLGSETILKTYQQFKSHKKFHFVKSFSFSAFNHILQHTDFLIGNSSCGIKEAPYYNIPVIDIGCRQSNRFDHLKLNNFYHIDSLENLENIINKIESSKTSKTKPTFKEEFFEKLKIIFTDDFFNIKTQKRFNN